MNVSRAKKVAITTSIIAVVVCLFVSFIVWAVKAVSADNTAMEHKYCAPATMAYNFRLDNDSRQHVVCRQPDGTLTLTGDK